MPRNTPKKIQKTDKTRHLKAPIDHRAGSSYYSSQNFPPSTTPSSIFDSFLKNTPSKTTPTTIITTTTRNPNTVNINTTHTTSSVLPLNSSIITNISNDGTAAIPNMMLFEGPANDIKPTADDTGTLQSEIETLQKKLNSLQNQLEKSRTHNEPDSKQLAFVSLNGDVKLFNNGNWKLSGIWNSIKKYNGRPLYIHSVYQDLCMCWTPKSKQWRIRSTLKSPVARAVLCDDVISPELSSIYWHVFSNDTEQFEDTGKFKCLSLGKSCPPIAGPTWLDLKHALENNIGGVSISCAYQKPLLEDMRKCIEAVSTLNGPSNSVWLEKLLGQIVAHEELKSQVRKFYYSLELMTERVRRSQCSNTEKAKQHMVFLGNPGTGKTMLARIMGGILHKAGILSKGHVVEVQRGDLVAGYVGQTAIKTRKQIEKAVGGVLFVDEAYRLYSVGTSENDFGIEAIDEMMSVLDEKQDIVIIFAGYPEEMNILLEANPGLRRRFPNIFQFSNYTAKELMAIFDKKLKESGFFLDHEIQLESIFKLKLSNHFISKHNGGLCDLLLSRCKESLALSLHGKCQDASDRQLNTFTEQMIFQAIDALIKPAFKSSISEKISKSSISEKVSK